MSTKSETAIARKPLAAALSKNDRALFDRAHERAKAIIAERGNLADESASAAIYAMALSLLSVAHKLMVKTPAEIQELRKDAVARRMADPTRDGAILARFDDWCEREDAYSAAILADADTDLGTQADEIATEILQLPTVGAEGLAVKTYLLIYRDCALSSPETAPVGTDAIVRDLIRFAPVLEPRCRAYLAALDAAETERAPAD